MRELNFSPGTIVEVNIDPDNSFDAWFPATVIEQVTNDSFLVEYQRSSEAGHQKVAVDSLHIRPSPPCSSNKAFNLLEKVDAFFDFRWLSGVVTKILAEGRYIVYFKRTKKEKELPHSDLRLHMEWTNGKWVNSSQDTSVTSTSAKKSDHAVNGGNKEKTRVAAGGTGDTKENVGDERISAVTLKSCQKVLQTPDSEMANHNSAAPSNKKIKLTSANGNSISFKSSKRLNRKNASDATLSPEKCNSKVKQTDGSSNGTSADVDTLIPSNPGESSLNQTEDSDQPSPSTETKGDHEKRSGMRRRGRPRKLLDLVTDVVDKTPTRSDVVTPLGPIVLGLTHDGRMITSLAGSSEQYMIEEPTKAMEDNEKNHDTSADHENVVNESCEQQKDDEVANLKRKRGRPPKVLFRVGSPKTKGAELVKESKDTVTHPKDEPDRHSPNNEDEKPKSVVEPAGITDSTSVGISDTASVGITDSKPSTMSPERPVQTKHVSDVHKQNVRSTARRQIRRPRKYPLAAVIEEKTEVVKAYVMKRGKRQRFYQQAELLSDVVKGNVKKRGKKQRGYPRAEPLIEDAVDDSSGTAAEVLNEGATKTAEAIVSGTSSNVSDDDKPLSAWFEGAHSPKATDGKVPLPGAAGRCDESGGRQDQNEMHPEEEAQEKRDEKNPGQNVSVENNAQERQGENPKQSTAIVPMNTQDLPFVKNSLIWEMIESMEVLKRIPQKPHFRPLYNCKEECREGLAIGNMVTFTSLVERVSKLQFSDPKTVVDGYLEGLVDLEELGFNVQPVRDQLKVLLSIKERYEQAENTSKEIEAQITERNNEKLMIDEEISELDRKMAELNEKLAMAVVKREMKDAEIALLQSSVNAVKESLQTAEEEFEKVTASLW